ncbi:MAG TPA: hypothetical protein VK574_18615 [Terracidiphilus sp.]|nr:hypothetical protein [Terracidiphilus sp.]
MKRGTDKTDVFPGTLRGAGDAVQYKCTVSLVTRLTPGTSANAVSTSLRIDCADQSPPDGIYRLDVRGRIFKVRRDSGKWPILRI